MIDDALPIRGWEHRLLTDLAETPLVYCYPGFMGAVGQRLVAAGLATREDAGLTEKPEAWPKRVKFEQRPQYRYMITEAGRERLAELESDAHDGEDSRASAKRS